ncbi:MAG: methyltransferase domain-containing protein, partial [Chloroflexi bacterium]|nr:methyltransferase domain-containing protein [Chloroflexota bacterium]
MHSWRLAIRRLRHGKPCPPCQTTMARARRTRFAWRFRSSRAEKSTQMDISPYDDWASIYDAVYSYVVEDIPFYVEEAVRSGAPVLELGCGTGRIAIPVAQSGVDIVAIDSSSAMLERARSKSESAHTSNLTLLQADMRDFEIDTQFTLIIVPFRGFLSLLSV